MAITVYTYNDKVLKNVATDKWLKKPEGPIYPTLADYSLRAKFTSGYDPTTDTSGAPLVSATQIDAVNNVWDITMSSDYFGSPTTGGRSNWKSNLIELLDMNCGDKTNIGSMFQHYTALTNVGLFDSSGITVMTAVFMGCTSLTTIPLFNTSNVTDMSAMFSGCTNVESGALALYQQASTQTTPPSTHTDTFKNCGSNTVTGAAELAQIPTSWGGTAS